MNATLVTLQQCKYQTLLIDKLTFQFDNFLILFMDPILGRSRLSPSVSLSHSHEIFNESNSDRDNNITS